MKTILTFDFGTTAVKGVLVDTEGNVVATKSVPIETFRENGKIEQEPEEWVSAFCSVSEILLKETEPMGLLGLAMSGQMQDVIPVDHQGRAIGRAILYSDGRSVEEADYLRASVGEGTFRKITGNAGQTTLVIPKLMWLKRIEPERYQAAECFLFSPKDYIAACLTGKHACDTTTSATVGAMDIHQKEWNRTILQAADISISQMPTICKPHDLLGKVTEEAARKYGLPCGLPVYAGIGDAGGTFFSSGLTDCGQYNIMLGTTGTIGSLSNHTIPPEEGIWNLPAMREDTYINVVPFLNAGGVHKWLATVLASNGTSPDYYELGKLLEQSDPCSNLLFLPYLSGERFPVVDSNATGCYIGITPSTTKPDMIRAALEGVCYLIRQGLETLENPPQKVVMVGGGAKESRWCQMMADVLEHDIIVPKATEMLSSAAMAACVLRGQGLLENDGSFIHELHVRGGLSLYKASSRFTQDYERKYHRYKQLYPSLRNLFAC